MGSSATTGPSTALPSSTMTRSRNSSPKLQRQNCNSTSHSRARSSPRSSQQENSTLLKTIIKTTPRRIRYATSSTARAVDVISACENSGGRRQSRDSRAGWPLRQPRRLLIGRRNPQVSLQVPNGLGTTARRAPLAPTDGLVLDLRDDLDGDKDGPLLIEDVPHLGPERFKIIEAIGSGIARFFGHAGVVDVLGIGHGLPACGGVTLVVEQEVVEVLGLLTSRRRQNAQVHEQGALCVKQHHLLVVEPQRHTERGGGCLPHRSAHRQVPLLVGGKIPPVAARRSCSNHNRVTTVGLKY